MLTRQPGGVRLFNLMMLAVMLMPTLAGAAAPRASVLSKLQPAVDNASTVRLLTFNIRYGLADDGDNSWPHRRDLVFGVLRNSSADFIGLQEALPFQI